MLIRSILVLGAIFLGGTTTAAPVATAFIEVPASGAGGQDSVEVVTLVVEGMTCGGCTLATRKVLTRLDGVEKAVVTYEPPRAVVTFDPDKVSSEQMIAAIKTLGYCATVMP